MVMVKPKIQHNIKKIICREHKSIKIISADKGNTTVMKNNQKNNDDTLQKETIHIANALHLKLAQGAHPHRSCQKCSCQTFNFKRGKTKLNINNSQHFVEVLKSATIEDTDRMIGLFLSRIGTFSIQ